VACGVRRGRKGGRVVRVLMRAFSWMVAEVIVTPKPQGREKTGEGDFVNTEQTIRAGE